MFKDVSWEAQTPTKSAPKRNITNPEENYEFEQETKQQRDIADPKDKAESRPG